MISRLEMEKQINDFLANAREDIIDYYEEMIIELEGEINDLQIQMEMLEYDLSECREILAKDSLSSFEEPKG